jgi:hemerythrin
MPFVEWGERYLLGVEPFDAHHKHLVDLMNEVYEMFLSKEVDGIELQKILDSLDAYTKYHFDLEESWMSQVDYPKQTEHILEHKKFIYKLFELNRQFRDDKTYLTLEMVSFLRRWLLDHILKADAQYAAYIHKRSAVD